jgi:hypothetical protein
LIDFTASMAMPAPVAGIAAPGRGCASWMNDPIIGYTDAKLRMAREAIRR